MADLSKIDSFALLGDADPVPQSLFLSHPEQAQTLTLLYESWTAKNSFAASPSASRK